MRGVSVWLWLATGCDEHAIPHTGCEKTSYADVDADGWGDPHNPQCGEDGSALAGDCDDEQPGRNPSADEICNGIDDDCDGAIDEAPSSPISAYADVDADGHGDPSQGISVEGCELPEGYVGAGDDCDDLDPRRSPSAPELCDGLDNRCDPAWTYDAERGRVTYFDESAFPFDVSIAFDPQGGEPSLIEIPGGELRFCQGSYLASIRVTGPSVISGLGVEQTVLDGVGGRIIEASADLQLQGLSLVGGGTYGGDGGAILQTGSVLSLFDVELRSNVADRGGAIAYLPADPSDPAALLQMLAVSMSGNHAGTGGGLFAQTGGAVEIVASSASGNDASGDGGGIAILGAQQVRLEQLIAESNVAVGRGGGLFVDVAGTISAEFGSFSSNASTSSGGGAHLESDTEIYLVGSIIADNIGGGIGGGSTLDAPVVDLSGLLVLRNSAPLDGGGLFVSASSASLRDSTLWSNVATAVGGGGGLAAEIDVSLVWSGGEVTENSAERGGGAFLLGNNAQTLFFVDALPLQTNRALADGGAIAMSVGTLALGAGLYAEENEAVLGGAVSVDSGSLLCDGTGAETMAFLRNSAYSGAAVLLGPDGSLVATGCDFGVDQDENVADDGSDLYIEEIPEGYDFSGVTSVVCSALGCE